MVDKHSAKLFELDRLEMATITNFYGIEKSDCELLVGEGKRVVLVTEGVKQTLMGRPNGLRLHCGGLRVFEKFAEGAMKISGACRYRICQESAEWVARMMGGGKRLVKLNREEMILLLGKRNVGLEELDLTGLSPGGVVLTVKEAEWILVAAVASSTELHCYANESAVQPILEYLVKEIKM